MTAAKGHLALIKPTDQVLPLPRAPWFAASTPGVSQLVAAVVHAAQQWVDEADTLASFMGWAPCESSGLGLATLRLLDAVHTLQARDAAPPDSTG